MLKNNNKIRNIFNDIKLETSMCSLDNISTRIHDLCPEALPVNVGTTLSVNSRLLLHYKDEGLTQDRLWAIQTADDDTARFMTAVTQNHNHRSVEPICTHSRIIAIEDEVKRHIDCTSVFRHSSVLDKNYDLEKVLKLVYEQFQTTPLSESVGRTVPVLIIDNAGIIPDEYPLYQLTLSDSIKVDDITPIQKVLGELNYCVIKYAENNPDAAKRELQEAIAVAKEKVAKLPYRARSSSAVMLLATAKWLEKKGIFYDSDIQEMMHWLQTEMYNRTTLSSAISSEIGRILSAEICSGRLGVGKSSSPPFWKQDMTFISSDGAINLTRQSFVEKVFSQLELPVGHNKVFNCLKAEDFCFANPGEDLKTRCITGADGVKNKQRFVSLSRNLLSDEAKHIVDMAVASDLFHPLDCPIDNFFPFIKHRHLDMVAGQVITDYKHGNPFISVTGTPGSGKTDWLHMQVVQRAKAGDVVVVFDPTNAFCKDELLAHRIPEEIIDNIFTFWDMSIQGWSINILEFEECEDITQRVQRLSSLLISGMHLTGPNQKAIVMTKAEEWLKEYEINNSLSIHDLPARFDGNGEERKLKTKLAGLLSTVKDMKNEVQPPGWSNLLTERGKVLVISAGIATIHPGANPFDILFDTLYSFKDKNREGRMTVVLDEVQTLNHRKDSTLVNVLSRGRKLDISVILASQDYLNRSLAAVYKYCGTHILFRPLGEECIRAVAEFTKLDVNVIRTLPNFCCAIMGSIYSKYNKKNIQLSSAVMGETYRPPYVGSYDE